MNYDQNPLDQQDDDFAQVWATLRQRAEALGNNQEEQ